MNALSVRIGQAPKFSFNKLFSAMGQLIFWWKPKSEVHKNVKYSYKKYQKTYELLEKYDREVSQDPETLADAGRLHPFISDLQKKSRKHGRTHSAN